jgi:hypothetical protein
MTGWPSFAKSEPDLIDGDRPSLSHDHPELVEDDVEHLVDVFAPERAQPPDVGTTDPGQPPTQRA